MNDKDNLKVDLENKINELKVLLDKLGNDLSEKKNHLKSRMN